MAMERNTLLRRALSVVLSLLLVAGGVPAPALAETIEGASGSASALVAEEDVALDVLVEEQPNGEAPEVDATEGNRPEGQADGETEGSESDILTGDESDGGLPEGEFSIDAEEEAQTRPDVEIETIEQTAEETIAVEAADSVLLAESVGDVSRAAWLSRLVSTFKITVGDEDEYPENYFGDLNSSAEHYYDVLKAVDFGIVDVRAGEDFNPGEPATREFAAHTLNFCLGFQQDEGGGTPSLTVRIPYMRTTFRLQ